MYNHSGAPTVVAGPNMSESTQSSDSSLAHSGHGQTSEASGVQSQDGSRPAASSTTLSATVSGSPSHKTNPTLPSSLPASSLPARAPASQTPAPRPTDPDLPSTDPLLAGVSPGVAAGPSGVVQSVMVNCHTDDIDIAAEADESISS